MEESVSRMSKDTIPYKETLHHILEILGKQLLGIVYKVLKRLMFHIVSETLVFLSHDKDA